MTIDELKQIPQTAEALYFVSNAEKIKKHLSGTHKVLQRKDFKFKDETLHTAKIILQTIKTIVDFHTSYIVGNPVTLSGSDDVVKLYADIYKSGKYALTDYKIVDNITKYGNAYEYVYIENGAIKSKVIDNLDSYPVYNDMGVYTAFVEHWTDSLSLNSYYILYEPDSVTEYSTVANGMLTQTAKHKNLTGLPIHYTSGVESIYSTYGVGVVDDLIPIMNEIEGLLSKTIDAVTTLSLNPLGVSSGQKIQTAIDKDITGVILNLEDGGTFNYASASIDQNTVNMLLKELINQFYAVAQIPSVVFNGNVSNVSEVSLKLLFTQLDNKAKRTALNLKSGFYERFKLMYKLIKQKPKAADFNSLDVVFNYNRPTDNSSIIDDLCKQSKAGALSKKSFVELSPYTSNADVELGLIQKESG